MRFSPRHEKFQKKISAAEKIPETIRSGQSRNSRLAGVDALKAANPNKIINDRKKIKRFNEKTNLKTQSKNFNPTKEAVLSQK